ncbi:hypothetical protein CAPTEDRAFT_196298 [Capitella teleta]|uniref:Receptor ligand binding region domain-containing protein n=1 Tax=Capitella teleta TaxID=283909 RepID=R7T4L0_CAPTE|nr:hypothetical protein CAPTEDRAFT_196298 [Capitella teleta]|eukprot:ELT87873.1 hypothetical protein CAPTEDRAFT_196298 [Capitella teleta]
MRVPRLLFWVLSVLFRSSSAHDVIREPLHLAGLFSMQAVGGSGGVLPAVTLALDHINDDRNILPGHQLLIDFNDTQSYSKGSYTHKKYSISLMRVMVFWLAGILRAPDDYELCYVEQHHEATSLNSKDLLTFYGSTTTGC